MSKKRGGIMTGENDARRLEAIERARLIVVYEETRNEAFLRAACCLHRDRGIDRADVYRILNESEPRGRGNVEKNDWDLLDGMAFLMLTENLERWPAAVRVAAEHPDINVEPTSTAKRLDRKFEKNPERHMKFARFALQCVGPGSVYYIAQQTQDRIVQAARQTHERVLRFPRKSKN